MQNFGTIHIREPLTLLGRPIQHVHFVQNLTNLAAVVRQEIPKLIRNILGAKITIDVHLRDICSELVKKQVTKKLHDMRYLIYRIPVLTGIISAPCKI